MNDPEKTTKRTYNQITRKAVFSIWLQSRVFWEQIPSKPQIGSTNGQFMFLNKKMKINNQANIHLETDDVLRS